MRSSTIRERFGEEIHITGGVSNISFGLPARRIISDTFLDLCVQAGQDSGIIDPVADIGAALNPDREFRGLHAGLGHADRRGCLWHAVHRGLPRRQVRVGREPTATR